MFEMRSRGMIMMEPEEEWIAQRLRMSGKVVFTTASMTPLPSVSADRGRVGGYLPNVICRVPF